MTFPVQPIPYAVSSERRRYAVKRCVAIWKPERVVSVWVDDDCTLFG